MVPEFGNKRSGLSGLRGGRWGFLLGAGIFLLMMAPGPVAAHRLHVLVWAKGDQVHAEGFYSDGSKPAGARIAVMSKAGKVLLRGKTDHEGRFSFRNPGHGGLVVVLDDGMGHRAEYGLTRAGPSLGLTRPHTESKRRATAPPPGSGTPAENLQSLVTATVDRKLDSLCRKMTAQRNGLTLKEILSALGCLFGFMGVALYVGQRK
jgi:hypothetical protein